MKKYIIMAALMLLAGFVKGQVYQLMPQYGYDAKRMKFDSTLQIPTVCGEPTLKSNVLKYGAIAFDSCNKKLYAYDPKDASWAEVSGGGATDTISISNRINAKADTSAVKLKLNITDTLPLSLRLNTKLENAERRKDSVFIYRNGSEVFAFKDSVQNGVFGDDTALVIYAKVHNSTGTQLNRGEVVMIKGATGDVASVVRANNKADSLSARTLGIVKDNIAIGGEGYVVTQGQASKLNTSMYSPGDILYLDSIDGQLTKVKPQAPYHYVFIAIVERANNGNGQMYVKPQNGQELTEIHDVRITNPLNNQILVYSDTLDVWKNKNLNSILLAVSPLGLYESGQNQLELRIDTASTGTEGSLTQYGYTLFNSKLGASDTTNLSNRINLKADITQLPTKLADVAQTPSDTIQSDLYVNQLGFYDASNDVYATSRYFDATFEIRDENNNSLLSFELGRVGFYNGSYSANIYNNNLTAQRNYTLPDSSGTFALLQNIPNVSGKLNVSDTATMLTPYLRKADTASLSNRINTKLNASDTLSLSNRINAKLSASDTTSLSNRINTKLSIADTLALQQKSIAAYSMLVNNTNAAANMTATNFRTSSGTYTGTIAWTGTTAPSGATTHSYRWQQMGNMVTLNISLVYGTAGSALTSVLLDLPGDAPTPLTPTGLSGNSSIIYPGSGHMSNTLTLSANNQRCALQTNSTNTGYQIINAAASAAYRYVEVTVTYFTQ